MANCGGYAAVVRFLQLYFARLGPIDAHAANGELGLRDMVQQRIWRGDREMMQTVGSVTSQDNETARFVDAVERSGVGGSAVTVTALSLLSRIWS
jgi:hypothetical protein